MAPSDSYNLGFISTSSPVVSVTDTVASRVIDVIGRMADEGSKSRSMSVGRIPDGPRYNAADRLPKDHEMATSTDTFTGFRPEAIQFLADLAANNDRAWFTPRKAEFDRLLKAPLEALCVALDERFRTRGIPLAADPTRSPFRIYRDVRFSKDKSPYKTNIGASFPWTGEGGGRPGGYFHLSPGDIFIGGGMWHPEPVRLAAFRHLVDSDPARVHAVIDEPDYVRTFGMPMGDRLSRVPKGYRADHPDAELLKLKDIGFGQQLADDDVASAGLVDLIADTLELGTPLLRLLATLPA
jgi:uncharacterized protein (TIGR02453 family)